MSKQTIKVIRAIEEIVKENPDFIYNKSRRTGIGCYYTYPVSGNTIVRTEKAKGCLIGQGILKAYPEEFEHLRAIDEKSPIPAYDLLKSRLFSGPDSHFVFLQTLQQNQDLGLAWKEAWEQACFCADFCRLDPEK